MFTVPLKSFQIVSSCIIDNWRTFSLKLPSSTAFLKALLIKNTLSKNYCSKQNKSPSSSSPSSESNESVLELIQNDKNNLESNLIKWAIQNNISFIAFSQLLKLLSDYGIKELPKNSRVLLKAKEAEIKVLTVPPGTYTHFGLENNLKNLITNLISKNVFNQRVIEVSIFIDNLPLSNVTQQGLWVILGSIVGFTNIVFCIGAYHGYSKPKDANLFLSELVQEAKILCMQGLKINENTYDVKIKSLICDAPAKAFVLNLKNCVGYSSCTKCNVIGEYSNRRISFEEKCNLRTDDDFHKNDIYRNKKTSLLEIPNFGIVSSVPLDYMHLVCLGVVKKILTVWLSSTKYWVCENCLTEVIKISDDLYPCEFQKKPKPLNQFSYWSATEFRRFLLYYGPVVLKNKLKEEYYEHFLLLHVACRLLCTEANKTNIEYGKQLLDNFVTSYKKLYEGEQITHNVHGLYHLADDSYFHGTLDNFSSFAFEKFLLKLRSLMHKSRKKSIPQIILKQSQEKVFEKSLRKIKTYDFKLLKKLKSNDEFQNFTHYERLLLKNGEIVPHRKGNNCVCLKNKNLVEVTHILERKEETKKVVLIAGKEFISVSDFYSDLFPSLSLDMFKAQKLSDTVTLWPVEMIDKKCMKIPSESDELVLVGLLDENF